MAYNIYLESYKRPFYAYVQTCDVRQCQIFFAVNVKLHEAEHSKLFETPTWRCHVRDVWLLNYFWSFNKILTTLIELENFCLKHFHSFLTSFLLVFRKQTECFWICTEWMDSQHTHTHTPPHTPTSPPHTHTHPHTHPPTHTPTKQTKTKQKQKN